MSQDGNISEKLDKILSKIDSLEDKMDKRLTKVEDQCSLLTKRSLEQERSHNYVLSEVDNLKVRVHRMEQERLANNIIIRGVKELEKDENGLNSMVDSILSSLTIDFSAANVKSCRRIGGKAENKTRVILVKMSSADAKLNIMQVLKNKPLDCSQFESNGCVWGTDADKIFLSDDLTRMSSDIFYKARQLRKKNRIKYAWSKLGTIYVRKDDQSQAVNILSVHQLLKYEKQLLSEESDPHESGSGSESEKATETDTTDSRTTKSKRKLDRSFSEPSRISRKKSPRPKRVKTRQETNREARENRC